MDERYFATLLALYGVEHESYRPGLLTYVDWSVVTEGGHPHSFEADDVTPQLLQVKNVACSTLVPLGEYQMKSPGSVSNEYWL